MTDSGDGREGPPGPDPGQEGHLDRDRPDRIPESWADVIIKATALQERANAALKAKGSPYRISEVAIGAAIPPSVTFAIARTDDPDVDVVPEGAVASTELLADVASTGEAVQALDGTMVDEAALIADGT
jgi:hypothetical protein